MILDYIEHLEFNQEEKDYMFDAEMTLARLSQGLFWIHRSVANAEKQVLTRAKKDDVIIDVTGGILEGIPMEWLSCAFQWYSVSLYNYIRLIGWLTLKDRELIDQYIKRVIPVVTKYRHKVSAHFSITAPKDDNEADQIASIMTNIVFANGTLRAGAMSEIFTDENGQEVQTSHHTSWSMTQVHKSLTPRFWPNGPMKAYNSLKISAHSTRKIKIDFID